MPAQEAVVYFKQTKAFEDAELKTRAGLTASAKAVPGNPNMVKLGVALTNVNWDAESLFDLSDFLEDIAVQLRKLQKNQPA